MTYSLQLPRTHQQLLLFFLFFWHISFYLSPWPIMGGFLFYFLLFSHLLTNWGSLFTNALSTQTGTQNLTHIHHCRYFYYYLRIFSLAVAFFHKRKELPDELTVSNHTFTNYHSVLRSTQLWNMQVFSRGIVDWLIYLKVQRLAQLSYSHPPCAYPEHTN